MRHRFACRMVMFALLPLAWMRAAAATQILVSPNGNDAGDGTRSRPFAS
ncbi:MAG TPA: hypothetical protein VF600_07245 [Abditibacteriaceae bacterium]